MNKILVVILSIFTVSNCLIAQNFCSKYFFVGGIKSDQFDQKNNNDIIDEIITEIEIAISAHPGLLIVNRSNYSELKDRINSEINIQRFENNDVIPADLAEEIYRTQVADVLVEGILRGEDHYGNRKLQIKVTELSTKESKFFSIPISRSQFNISNNERENIIKEKFLENFICQFKDMKYDQLESLRGRLEKDVFRFEITLDVREVDLQELNKIYREHVNGNISIDKDKKYSKRNKKAILSSLDDRIGVIEKELENMRDILFKSKAILDRIDISMKEKEPKQVDSQVSNNDKLISDLIAALEKNPSLRSVLGIDKDLTKTDLLNEENQQTANKDAETSNLEEEIIDNKLHESFTKISNCSKQNAYYQESLSIFIDQFFSVNMVRVFHSNKYNYSKNPCDCFKDNGPLNSIEANFYYVEAETGVRLYVQPVRNGTSIDNILKAAKKCQKTAYKLPIK